MKQSSQRLSKVLILVCLLLAVAQAIVLRKTTTTTVKNENGIGTISEVTMVDEISENDFLPQIMENNDMLIGSELDYASELAALLMSSVQGVFIEDHYLENQGTVFDSPMSIEKTIESLIEGNIARNEMNSDETPRFIVEVQEQPPNLDIPVLNVVPVAVAEADQSVTDQWIQNDEDQVENSNSSSSSSSNEGDNGVFIEPKTKREKGEQGQKDEAKKEQDDKETVKMRLPLIGLGPQLSVKYGPTNGKSKSTNEWDYSYIFGVGLILLAIGFAVGAVVFRIKLIVSKTRKAATRIGLLEPTSEPLNDLESKSKIF